MNKKAKFLFIIISSIITIALLYICDQILTLNYNTKITIKLILFTLVPAIYMIKTNQNFLKESVRNATKINNIKTSFFLGIFVFTIIMITYKMVQPFIDIDTLINEFENKYEINKNNIVYYGLYITFINSLLEEGFFRGFIFLNLKKIQLKKWAYVVSSLTFSIYHIANFQNWFSWQVFILACVSLFIGGMIFNYLDDRPNTFFNSWFVHICADIAIILIGFRIFEVI